jgi:hypothetical protein
MRGYKSSASYNIRTSLARLVNVSKVRYPSRPRSEPNSQTSTFVRFSAGCIASTSPSAAAGRLPVAVAGCPSTAMEALATVDEGGNDGVAAGRESDFDVEAAEEGVWPAICSGMEAEDEDR